MQSNDSNQHSDVMNNQIAERVNLEHQLEQERNWQRQEEEYEKQRKAPPPLRSANTASHRSAERYNHAQHNEQGIYAIIDTTTHTIAGQLQLHRSTASAIRTTSDIANADTMVHRHPLDFQLRLLGTVDQHFHITAAELPDVILTGDQIATMIQLSDHKGA